MCAADARVVAARSGEAGGEVGGGGEHARSRTPRSRWGEGVRKRTRGAEGGAEAPERARGGRGSHCPRPRRRSRDEGWARRGPRGHAYRPHVPLLQSPGFRAFHKRSRHSPNGQPVAPVLPSPEVLGQETGKEGCRRGPQAPGAAARRGRGARGARGRLTRACFSTSWTRQ